MDEVDEKQEIKLQQPYDYEPLQVISSKPYGTR